jgi:hypothetical protein
MKKYSRTKATGNIGVAFVENIVSEAGCMFRQIPQDTDVGIDGYIEFVENEIATGSLVAIQIKAGESFLKQYSDGKYFAVNASKEDMNYWNDHTIPVALIAYDPATKMSDWLDITGYIRQNLECLEKKNTTLTIHSQSSTFSSEALQDKFKNTFIAFRNEADLFKYVDLMVSLDDEKRFQGFLGLMSHPKSRFSEITCHFLFEYLFDENDNIRASITDALSRYLNHPEVGFYPPKEIRDYVKTKLRVFGRDEVANLLKTAWLDEERLMERGSLGQCTGVIIVNIPNHEDHLGFIALHNEFKDEIRIATIALAEEFGMETIIERIVYEFDKTDWGTLRDQVKVLVESYAEFADTSFKSIFEDAIYFDSFDDDEIAYALKEAGTPMLAFHENLIRTIEGNTNNPNVKFYAQRAIDKIMRYKSQSNQDPLPGFENT